MRKLFLFSIFISIFGFSQNSENACKTLNRINNILKAEHFKPKVLNDSLSATLFSDFFQNLDDKNSYFIQSEIESFKKHKYKIDDYIISSNCDFLEEIFVVYKNSLQRNLTLVEKIKTENIGLETSDTIIFFKGPRPFIKNEIVLKKLLKKRIVFDVYEEIAKQSKNRDSLLININTLKPLAIEKVFSNQICKIQNLLNNLKLKEMFYADFYKTFCVYFDPHTTYLSIEERDEFVTSLNSSDNSLGIIIEINETDEFFVGKILAGSTSFFDDKISIGDQILKFNTINEEIGINCTTFEKINNLLTDNKVTSVKVTFRKKDGTIYSSNLIKSKIKNYNNTAYSLVIDKQSKIGYLKIPSFYFDEFGNNPVSNDVFKEIYKLKENKIEGLIIDLEFNGGGSTEECVKLLGMFLDFGPVAILTDKTNEPIILRDFNRGVVYSDPIVVMVNGLSASASEIFANALKDHNRAIIVGNPTFGKGTMQTILPLQYYNKNNQEFIKITIEKFYQINGGSNQIIGVKPHIEIPTLFNNLMPKEKDEKHSFKNDSLHISLDFKFIQNDFSQIIKNSNKRIESNTYFTNVNSINSKIYKFVNRKERKVLLKFKNVFADVHSLDSIYEETEKLSNSEFGFDISLTSFDEEKSKLDEDLKTDFKDKIKNAKTNARLFEAINVMNELIQQKKS